MPIMLPILVIFYKIGTQYSICSGVLAWMRLIARCELAIAIRAAFQHAVGIGNVSDGRSIVQLFASLVMNETQCLL
jgi:hypothetical protein